MKKFYITGCTAGLFPFENQQRFQNIADQIENSGAEKVTTVVDVEVQSDNFQVRLDARMRAVAEADCIVFTADWDDSIESRVEFLEAGRLGKQIRIANESDLNDIKRTLRGDFIVS